MRVLVDYRRIGNIRAINVISFLSFFLVVMGESVLEREVSLEVMLEVL